jgi:hypothetical protein
VNWILPIVLPSGLVCLCHVAAMDRSDFQHVFLVMLFGYVFPAILVMMGRIWLVNAGKRLFMSQFSEITGERMHVYRHGRGTDESHLRDQALFKQLLVDHKQLRRETERLPNGIRVQTTSENPDLARILREHVEGMKVRFGMGRAIRSWDPLFSALFEYRDQISMNYRVIDKGVEAELTAEDPKLIELIHCHDQTLHQFVDRGFDASQHPSPVPSWVQDAYRSD